jgi:hypothetical protein
VGVLDVAGDVAELVSPEDLAQLETTAAAGYECLVCERPATLADGVASVVLLRSEPLIVARIAHRACRASAVEDLPPGALQVREDVDGVAVAGLWPSVDGLRPVLVLDIPYSLAMVERGDRVDALASYFLRRGLQLVTSAGRTPGPAGAGWAIGLPSPGSAVVVAPGGDLVYEGSLSLISGWVDLVDAFGGAVLLIGSNLGMADVGPHDLGITRVNKAARAGLLVGGVVPVLGE